MSFRIFVVCLLLLGVQSRADNLKSHQKLGGTHFQKLMYVIFENTNFDPTIKQSFFKSFADSGVLFTNFYAETHPSQPNYVAMISGDTMGVDNDDDVQIDGTSIVDLLEDKGMSWKVYLENYPGGCFTGSTSSYVRRHNPFISFLSIQSDPKRCSHLVSADELDKDIAQNTMPQYSFYVPNLENDGHDSDIQTSNSWFQNKFTPILANESFLKDMLIIATFDEGRFFSWNQIYTAMVGPSVKPGSISKVRLNHSSIIKMIEDNFDLGSLGHGESESNDMDGFWL